MEVNFSNKQEDDDEIDSGKSPFDGPEKDDGAEPVVGVPEDIKLVEKVKILEEKKEDPMKKLGT